MTCIVSYLMFKVNSEVRFKWLLFHFLCKPKIINQILKSNTQQINSKYINVCVNIRDSDVTLFSEEFSFTDLLHILTEQLGGCLRPKRQQSLDI